jgi:hypothetical protein
VTEPPSALRTLPATRVIRAFREGSSWPVLVETASGRFIAKLRGAAEGTTALIAEVMVAELAEALGLPVPERVLIEFEAAIPSDDRLDELRDLLERSVGLNLGFRWLDGATTPTARELAALDPAFVASVLFLDGLVMNPDRTPKNPNLLLWKRQPWLIDHGAALPFQHWWSEVEESSPREPSHFSSHLFGPREGLVRQYEATLASRMTREVLLRASSRIPEDFLRHAFPGEDPERVRARYAAFLWKRLKPPRPFVLGTP